jgi:hypothetical protein
MKTTIAIFASVILVSGVAESQTFTNGVSVSEPFDGDLSPVEFDQQPAQMSREQFYAYCVQFNAKQIASAKVRHQEYLTERGPMPVTQISSSSGSSNTRRGGGYGMGGFGGAGGYLGYNNGGGFGGGGFGGFGGGGFGGGGFGGGGFGGLGNNTSSSYSNTSTYTESVLPDMNDAGGGPATIINPYCHNYWKQPNHFRLVTHLEPSAPAPAPDFIPSPEP